MYFWFGGAFYHSDVHKGKIPAEAAPVSTERHDELLEGERKGHVIVTGEDGAPILRPRPAPSLDVQLKWLIADVQRALDEKAKAYGYDDIKTAVTYAEEPAVTRFQVEGLSFRAWRSAVWEKCYAEIARVEKGERSLGDVDAFLAALPAFVAPEEPS